MRQQQKSASEQSCSGGWIGLTRVSQVLLYLCDSRPQSSREGTDTCSNAYRCHRGHTVGSTWLKHTSHVDFDR